MIRKWMLLPVLTATLVSAAPLTQGERDFAMSHMHASRKLFLDSVANLTPEQLNFKAGPDRWSIAECAEHIALAEDFISGSIQEKIMKGPAVEDKRTAEEIKMKDDLIVKAVVDRSHKFQAPEPIRPVKTFATIDEAVAHFKESRDKNIAYIETTTDDLRGHVAPHPVAGPLDSYEWYLLMSAHTERHTLQIEEVKAAANYPK